MQFTPISTPESCKEKSQICNWKTALRLFYFILFLGVGGLFLGLKTKKMEHGVQGKYIHNTETRKVTDEVL